LEFKLIEREIVDPRTLLRITQVNRGRLDPEMARRSLLDAIYRKQFLVNYVGHGSVNQWRGNLLMNGDALALRDEDLPMFLMMTWVDTQIHGQRRSRSGCSGSRSDRAARSDSATREGDY
jgi:hypothetical protein